MSKAVKTLLGTNVLLVVLVFIAVGHAQRPPETDVYGTTYLPVNINPTNVPPMVNINPNQLVPRVQVTEMPEIRMPPRGCENRINFTTGVGRSITGPLMITYLHLPDQTRMTLSDASGSHSMNLGSAGQITTAIFLQSAQQLNFDADIMYSGCKAQ